LQVVVAVSPLPCGVPWRTVRLVYQPPASSIFLSEQTSHQQPASNTFLSEQTSHQPPAKPTGWAPACLSVRLSPFLYRGRCAFFWMRVSILWSILTECWWKWIFTLPQIQSTGHQHHLSIYVSVCVYTVWFKEKK
jgi:hypothetical protein